MQILSQYQVFSNNSKFNNSPSFGRKLNLLRYGDAGLRLKEITNLEILGQKNGENTVMGLAILGLGALLGENLADKTPEEIKTEVSNVLKNMRNHIAKTDSKKRKEEKQQLDRELLQEMSDSGMTLKQIGTKLDISGSAVSIKMKKYGIKTDFSKKYNTGLSKIKNNSVKLQKALNERIYRQKIFETLKDYPELLEKYKRLLVDTQKYPDNEYNSDINKTFEKLISRLMKPEEVKYLKEYFEALNTKYINDIENICINYDSNDRADGSYWKFMTLLKGEKISSKELEEWTQYPLFNCDEFMTLRDYKPEQKKRLEELKRNGEISAFETFKGVFNLKGRNIYNLTLGNVGSNHDRMKTICKVHEILYETPIILGNDKCSENLKWFEIKDEIFSMLKHDKQLNSIYNIMKLLGAKELQTYNYTCDQVRDLKQDSKEYKELFTSLREAVCNYDFENPNNEKMKILLDIVNRKEIFKDLMVSPHSIIRYISRIAMKNDTNIENLERNVTDSINSLDKEIKETLDTPKLQIWTYQEKYRPVTAPMLRVKNSELGAYLTITLDKNGYIHTIFEDQIAIDKTKNKKIAI